MEFLATLAAAIHSYTGLSPPAFFTILALMVGAYLLVSALFVAPDAAEDKERSSVTQAATPQEAAPIAEAFVPPEPVQLGDMTMQELSAYDGSDSKKPLLLAIKGQIFDVARGRHFEMISDRPGLQVQSVVFHMVKIVLGPGWHYSFFAGREISRALALMSFDPQTSMATLKTSSELEILHDWEEKFEERYVKVGRIVPEISSDSCEDANENSRQAKTN